jgi:hypothetical protein
MVTQLIVMNDVPVGPAHQAPGLDFVVWYLSKMEVLKDQFLSVWVRVGWLGDNYYHQSGLPGLASWPGRGPWVGIHSWCWVAFTRWTPQHGCRVVFIVSSTNMPDRGCSRLDKSQETASATSLSRRRI